MSFNKSILVTKFYSPDKFIVEQKDYIDMTVFIVNAYEYFCAVLRD